MTLIEKYKRVFISLLTNEELYSHGWITVQRYIFSKEDSYSKTGIIGSKYDRMFIPKICKQWLYARLFGPVSDVWVARSFCYYSDSYEFGKFGGFTVFRLTVARWEENLSKVIYDSGNQVSLNVFAMLHYKKDTESVWFRMDSDSSIPSVRYSAVTSDTGLFKNGEYEWIILIGPSILRMFTTGQGGIGYQHKEGLLYNSDKQYDLVVKNMQHFNQEASQIMMFFEGKSMEENSVTVVHAARECRIFESVFFNKSD